MLDDESACNDYSLFIIAIAYSTHKSLLNLSIKLCSLLINDKKLLFSYILFMIKTLLSIYRNYIYSCIKCKEGYTINVLVLVL